MLVHKNSANISIFSLMLLVEISVFCEVLLLSNLGIYFLISSIFTSSKWNILLFLYFWIARMLGWFLYFKIALESGSLMFSLPESSEWNFGISGSFTIFKKKLFKVCCFTFRCECLSIFYFLSGYSFVRKLRFGKR